MRGVLLAFQPLRPVERVGRARASSSCGVVRRAATALAGERLMCGFYLNELLLRLLPREDPHEALFDATREPSPPSRRAAAGGRCCAASSSACSPSSGMLCCSSATRGHGDADRARAALRVRTGARADACRERSSPRGRLVVQGPDAARHRGGRLCSRRRRATERALMRSLIGQRLDRQAAAQPDDLQGAANL